MEFKEFIEDSLKECVVAAVKMPEGTVLAKNRDRGYKAKVEVLHELIDGVEVMMWHDTETDWSEGMNEYGIGIVNSSLLVVKDEKESKESLRNGVKKKKMTTDGKRIRRALTEKTLDGAVSCLLGKRNGGTPLTGQTIVSDGNETYVLEIAKKYKPVVEKVAHDITVRTNHGIHHKRLGYIRGEKRDSSHSRMELAQEKLQGAKKPIDVINILKKKHVSEPFMNPYRVRTDHNMQTTGQILLDLPKREVTIRMDYKEGEFLGVKNMLPMGRKPKIKVKIIKSQEKT
jgi:hypothetical protein